MINTVKGATKSRLVWLGVVLVFLGTMMSTVDAWKHLIPAEYQGLFISIVGAIVVALRAVTTQPLSEKGE